MKTAGIDTNSLLHRLHRALGPLAGGMILDALDLFTFGPIGLCGGFIVAALVGWWISSIYRFSTQARIIFSVLAAIYIAIPFTEIFPLATLISAIARFWEHPCTPDEWAKLRKSELGNPDTGQDAE